MDISISKSTLFLEHPFGIADFGIARCDRQPSGNGALLSFWVVSDVQVSVVFLHKLDKVVSLCKMEFDGCHAHPPGTAFFILNCHPGSLCIGIMQYLFKIYEKIHRTRQIKTDQAARPSLIPIAKPDCRLSMHRHGGYRRKGPILLQIFSKGGHRF